MALPRALLVLVVAALPTAGVACAVVPQAAVEIGPAQAPVASSEEMDEPAKKAAPSGPGCSWTALGLQARDEKLPLCFAVDGACFATLAQSFSGKVKLTLPEGKSAETGARLELDDLAVHLEATTAGDAVVLYPQKPIPMGAMLVSGDGQGLFVERVHGDSIELTFSGDASLRLRGGPLHLRAGCMDVGPERAAWSDQAVLSAVGIPASSRPERILTADRPVALSASPGGAAMADIPESETGALDVELLEQKGPSSRILMWLSGGGALFGWVDSGALSPAPQRPAYGSIGTLGHGGGFGQPFAPGTVCPRDVPLLAEVGGTRAEVGILESGARFDVGRPASTEHTQVRLRSYKLDLLPDSRWLVRTAALEGCKVQ